MPLEGGTKSGDLLGHRCDLRFCIGEILDLFGNILDKLPIYSLEDVLDLVQHRLNRRVQSADEVREAAMVASEG